MDRVILGKSPEVESGTDPKYRRAGKSGLFISRPGANVMSCSQGDLIFDSTAPDFLQVMKKGRATIPNAASLTAEETLAIDTGVKTPHANEKATVLVRWNALVPSSNLHPTAYSSSWGTSVSESYVVVPPYLRLDSTNLGNPSDTGLVPGHSLTAKTKRNSAGNVEIEFKNGSPYRSHTVAWTLYRTEGV